MGSPTTRWWRPGHRRAQVWGRFGIALLFATLVVGPATAWTTSEAAFRATTTTSNSMGTAVTFPNYPTTVNGDSPWAYHRSDDAISTAATSAVADSSSNSRPGTYRSATKGPAVWWKFDENAGTTAADSSGAVRQGTLTSSGIWATGGSGSAVNFDGTGSDYVSGISPVDTSQSFSVSAWAYLSNITGTGNGTVVAQIGSSISAFWLMWNGGGTGKKWAFVVRSVDSTTSTAVYARSSASAVGGAWCHLVGVSDSTGDTIALYLNGALQTSIAETNHWNGTNGLAVGHAQYGGNWGDYLNGKVDDVQMYARALSAAEVTTLYNGGTPGVALAPLTAQIPGALQGSVQGQQSSTAVAFGGTTGLANNNTSMANPTTFTIECWVRAVGRGGTLIGLQDSTSTMGSGTADRVLYIDSGGKVTFAVKPAAVVDLRSTTVVNDGTWHHVAGSLGAAGMKLYVDGDLEASNGTTTAANIATGYWRWGGVYLSGFNNRPTSDYLLGTLDEIAIWNTQLSDQQLLWQFHSNF